MKSVFVSKVSVENGLPCIFYNVTMVSVHDTKGKFGVGFKLVDKEAPHVLIYNDEGVTIGIITKPKLIKRFLREVIRNRGYKDFINYVFPPTATKDGELIAEPVSDEFFVSLDGKRLGDFKQMLSAFLEVEKK